MSESTQQFVPVALSALAQEVASIISALQLAGIDVSETKIGGVPLAQAIAASATNILNDQRGAAGGVVALSEDGNLMLGGFEAMGVTSDGHFLMKINLPTSDPHIPGVVWINGGYWMSSQG